MTTTTTAATATRARGLLFALVLGAAGGQINITMLNPALPDVMDRLHADSGQTGLAQTAFFLVGAVAQIVLTRLSDYRRRRPVLLATLGMLLVGEMVCAAAPDIAVFTVGRALQGVGAAMFSLSYLILHRELSPARFGRALGLITGINGGIAGVDVVFGGVMADTIGFRGVFVASAVLTVAALTASWRWVPDRDEAAPEGRLDRRGAVLLGLGLAAVLLALDYGGTWGWTSPKTLATLCGGALLLLSFAPAQRRGRDPLIDLGTLASRRVWPLLAVTTCVLAGVFGMYTFTIPLLAQNPHAGYGLSATAAALLYLTPMSAVGLASAPVFGHFGARLGWRRCVRAGVAASGVCVLLIALAPGNRWLVLALLAVLGVTYTGCCQTALTGLSVESAPADKPGSVPGINGSCFALGSSLGIAVAAGAAGGFPTLTPAALHAALWTSVGFVVLAAAAAALIAPAPRTGLATAP